MVPLIDFLETYDPPVQPDIPGRYDDRKALRVDDLGRPVVEATTALTGTQTRGGADRDQAPNVAAWLGTVTKADADRDHPGALLGTKTGAGRDTDEPAFARALLHTVTFAGPDRD